MVWGNGGCELTWPAAPLMFSTNIEGNVRLRRANSSIGTRIIHASIGLPAANQDRTIDPSGMIDELGFKKLLRRVDRSGGESPVGAQRRHE